MHPPGIGPGRVPLFYRRESKAQGVPIAGLAPENYIWANVNRLQIKSCENGCLLARFLSRVQRVVASV